MSLEGRKPFSFGPLARERYRKAGKLASLALVMAVGLATPSAAVGRGEAGHGNAALGGDNCEHRAGTPRGDHDKDKCPKPPKPSSGCFDIDSAAHTGNAKFVSVVCNGRVFVLTVDERGGPTVPPTPIGGWTSVGSPGNVIDATLAINDDQLFVTVLTADGRVLEASCKANPAPQALGSCTQFTQFPSPPA